jgi:hypothetical protein
MSMPMPINLQDNELLIRCACHSLDHRYGMSAEIVLRNEDATRISEFIRTRQDTP